MLNFYEHIEVYFLLLTYNKFRSIFKTDQSVQKGSDIYEFSKNSLEGYI